MTPKIDVALSEGKECVRQALEELEVGVRSHGDSATGKASEEEEMSFVSNMGGLEKQAGGEPEWITFADILRRADLFSKTFLGSVVVASDFPLC